MLLLIHTCIVQAIQTICQELFLSRATQPIVGGERRSLETIVGRATSWEDRERTVRELVDLEVPSQKTKEVSGSINPIAIYIIVGRINTSSMSYYKVGIASLLLVEYANMHAVKKTKLLTVFCLLFLPALFSIFGSTLIMVSIICQSLDCDFRELKCM